MSCFHISEEVSKGGGGTGRHIVELAVSGEIDYAVCPRFRERVFGHIEAGRRHLLLDLSLVSFIDSMAIGVLVAAVTRLQQAGGGALVVVCAGENARVLRIFDIAGVASVVPLYRSREEARAALLAAVSLRAPSLGGRDVPSCDGVGAPVGPAQPSALEVARKYAERCVAADAAQLDPSLRTATMQALDELA